ncbi:MAG: L-aspartate oxidase [Bacteroidetes bacterium]|nr:L-aspartate oxidase [Bacteroidota bacterium]
MKRTKVDFLVIGSGIAGLNYALKAAEFGKVLIITKADEDESNTKYAQGGIAAVIDPDDSFEKHVQDTLVAGDGLCDEEVVRMVIKEGPERIQDIITWGADFDKKPSGEFDLAKEGGHSESRILHFKDITGLEIERKLLQKIHAHPNIELHTHFFAVDIITQHHLGVDVRKDTPDIACYGLYVLNLKSGEIETILSKITLMATGGAGNVYMSTTNPRIATGDGIAMVYRAKGNVRGMEYIQFHPTALYHPGERPAFLISEAVRGFGGILKTRDGNEFMQRYDTRLSLAPRDIVARAIDNEMKVRGDDFVYLDCRHSNAEEFINHFPNIHNKFLSLGIDFRKDYIPVVPAAHYTCGGIVVDMNARTTIANLYAAGECSSTGLHGANRLASNSLLEAAVYAHRAFVHGSEAVKNISFNDQVPDWNASGTKLPEEMVLITHNLNELQKVMSDYVGIVRTNLRLKRAYDRLKIIYQETELLYQKTVVSVPLMELRNLINVAYLIVKGAMACTENRGLHYNTDLLPDKKENKTN